MKSPICVTNLCVTSRKQTGSFSIASLLLAVVPLWLMLVAADTSAHAQTPDDVSNSASPAASLADWTEFHRENMQRWNPYETVLGVDSVGSLQLKWKNSIASVYLPPCCSQIPSSPPGFTSSPAAVNGVIYFGGDDGTTYALNASTGAKLWSTIIGAPVQTSPAVANGVVYVASVGANLISPYVFALNADTGTVLWSYMTTEDVLSSPTVVSGVVYTTCGGNGLSTVCALNANTGALLWNNATPGGLLSSPAVANGVVYVGSANGNVYALNASTGATVWSYFTGNTVNSSPAVANEVVYIGSENGNVDALNASTGAKLWSYATGDYVDSSPAVANGVVYIGSGNGNVYALNASTGAKLWSSATGSVVLSSPAVANGVVYVGSNNGNVYALNAGTGAWLWNFDTGVAMNSSPAVAHGVVYVHAGDLSGHGSVYAFSIGADLFLRIRPTPETVHQGDLLTYAFPVWNLGPDNADYEVLNTQVPEGTTFDYIRISGTPGLGTCTHPPYGGTGEIVCHENSAMAPNATWTVRLTVKVTAPSGTVITESAATMADTPDPNMANNMATVSTTVQ
jgi:outer membrane protein assembly factor BamB